MDTGVLILNLAILAVVLVSDLLARTGMLAGRTRAVTARARRSQLLAAAPVSVG